MIERIVLLLLFTMSFIPVFAQTELKDDFDKGTQFLKVSEYRKAVTKFSEVLKKATDDKLKKFCYIYRGIAYQNLKDYKKSLADFDEAIKLDPADIASYGDRGFTKILLNDFKGAIEDYKHILTQDSTGKQAKGALYYLAKIADQEHDYEMSVKYYDKLIPLTPNEADLYFNRGCAKGMLMKPDEAISDYNKAIELKPDYTYAYANRGIAKINMRTSKGNIKPTKDQTADACTDLEKAKELGDNTVDDMIYIYCNKK